MMKKKYNPQPLDKWFDPQDIPNYVDQSSVNQKQSSIQPSIQNNAMAAPSDWDSRLKNAYNKIVGGINDLFGYIDNKFKQYDTKLNDLENKYKELDNRVKGLENRVGGLERRLDEFEKETNRRFDAVRGAIDTLADTVGKIPYQYGVVQEVECGAPGAVATPDGKCISFYTTTGPVSGYKPVAEGLNSVKDKLKEI